LLTLLIILEIIGGIFLFREISSVTGTMTRVGLTVVLGVMIGIGIWVLLQTKKMIDFLFDLAEEKADISHKH